MILGDFNRLYANKLILSSPTTKSLEYVKNVILRLSDNTQIKSKVTKNAYLSIKVNDLECIE